MEIPRVYTHILVTLVTYGFQQTKPDPRPRESFVIFVCAMSDVLLAKKWENED